MAKKTKKKMSANAKAKASMKCGQVKKSYKKGKKVMKKVCNKDGSSKIIHAGDSRYSSNTTPQQRKNYRKRHNCDTAKPNTPQKLACEALWSSKAKSYKGTSAEKRKNAKTGKSKK